MTAAAPATRRAYDRSWALFRAWCAGAGLPAAPPVSIAQVVTYLEALPPGLGRSGLALRVAGIAHGHRLAGMAWTERHPAIGAALRRRQLDPAALRRRLDGCGTDLAGLRDRMLLLLDRVAGLRPGQIATLDREDVALRADGMDLQLRPVAADETVVGQTVAVSRRRGDAACAVAALERWLLQANITYGPIAQRLGAHGWPGGGMSDETVRRLLRDIERRAADDPATAPRGPVAGAWRGPAARKTVAAKRRRSIKPGRSSPGLRTTP